jgi:hypothetical protein
MDNFILLGRGRDMQRIPRAEWEKHLASAPEQQHKRLSFMTPAHHQVRYFVVRELSRKAKPMEPEFIAQQLLLPLAQVTTILADLERNLFFLARNETGAVTWAYPVTVELTPHRIMFSTGERAYAA